MSTVHQRNSSIPKTHILLLSFIIACFFSGTISAGAPYCESSSKSSDKVWVARVKVGSFEHLSGPSLYSDFTQQIINISACGALKVDLTPGYKDTPETTFFYIWMDNNDDGDFNDTGENVFSDSGIGPVTATFDAHVTKMSPRMRVAMSRYPLGSSCEIFEHGEVEDYSIRAVPPPPVVYDIRMSIVGQGSVTSDPDKQYFNPCELVTFTATGDNGWIFDHWSEDLSGKENPVVISMKSNMNITAHFVEGSSPGQPSCVGYCGSQSPKTGCWCDSSCERYGDCCPDKVKICGAN